MKRTPGPRCLPTPLSLEVLCTPHLHIFCRPSPPPCADQNELGVLEFIHCFVEVLDKHFGQVCELDIMNEPEIVSTCSSLPPPRILGARTDAPASRGEIGNESPTQWQAVAVATLPLEVRKSVLWDVRCL